MSLVYFYSDSEEFLEGVEIGVEFAAEKLTSVQNTVTESNDDKYPFVLVLLEMDGDREAEFSRYYKGSSLQASYKTETPDALRR